MPRMAGARTRRRTPRRWRPTSTGPPRCPTRRRRRRSRTRRLRHSLTPSPACRSTVSTRWPPTSARCSAIRCSRPRGEARSRSASPKTQDAAARRAPRYVEPAPRGQARLRVPPRLQEHHGPHPGGQHRPDAGGEALRPLPRREALLVRGVVDPRVHPPVHPEQLAAREARDHAGAAQALLQPAEKAPSSSRWASSPTDAEIAKRLNVAESGGGGDGRPPLQRRSRSTLPSATPTGGPSPRSI